MLRRRFHKYGDVFGWGSPRRAAPAVTTAIFAASLTMGLAQGDFQKGFSYYKQGQYEKAATEFEQIVRDQPDYEDGHRILGDCYLKLKQFEKAAAAFQDSIRLQSDQFVSYRGLATAYFNTQKYGETVATLLRAERYAKTAAQKTVLWRLRGSAYFNQEEYRKAVVDLEKANAAQRGKYVDLLQLGIAHFNLGQLEEASSYLDQALQIEPRAESAKTYRNKLDYKFATLAIQAAEYAKARDILQSYLREQPEDGEAWFNLGIAFLFNKELTDAEGAFLKSAEILETYWETYDRLGFIYEKTNQYQKSLENYQRAQDLRPSGHLQESIERIKKRLAQS